MKTKTGASWKKPFIGFEPMTYALPWRYSTTELKGPIFFTSIHEEATYRYEFTAGTRTCTLYVYIYMYE